MNLNSPQSVAKELSKVVDTCCAKALQPADNDNLELLAFFEVKGDQLAQLKKQLEEAPVFGLKSNTRRCVKLYNRDYLFYYLRQHANYEKKFMARCAQVKNTPTNFIEIKFD